MAAKLPDANPSRFGGRVQIIREQLGYDRPGFAKLLGVDTSTVGRWENKYDEPPPLGAKRTEIVEALEARGANPRWLVEHKGSPFLDKREPAHRLFGRPDDAPSAPDVDAAIAQALDNLAGKIADGASYDPAVREQLGTFATSIVHMLSEGIELYRRLR